MRLLLARAGALGDLLLLRRVIAAVRRAGHGLTLLAPPSARALVGPGSSEVDRHLDWDAPEAAALMAGGRLPDGPFRQALLDCDMALSCSRSVELAHGLARLIPVTVAYDPLPPPGGGHASAWFARPIAALGLAVDEAPPALRPTAAEHEAARPWLERLPAGFLALHPGSGSRAKNWPFERFLELAEALAPETPWLLVLGPAEAALLAQAQAPARAVIARDLPLRTLAALLSRAGRYAGNDSGVTHLAAACGVRTLALFGPSDPALWAPEGAHATTLRAPGGDLAALALDAVRAALR